MTIELLNIDCMEYMAGIPDKVFDLAVVDPPYGIGNTLVIGGTWAVKYQKKGVAWDIKPDKKYFDEIRRVSKNQIIWGGNYFTEFIKPARCFIVWSKPNLDNMHTMADCELALTSFDNNARTVKITSLQKEARIHVTQKPIALYRWIFQHYAKPGQRILDTHLCSGSSAIAAHYAGLDFVGCELDKEYFDAAQKRFNQQTKQKSLFLPEAIHRQQHVQKGIMG